MTADKTKNYMSSFFETVCESCKSERKKIFSVSLAYSIDLHIILFVFKYFTTPKVDNFIITLVSSGYSRT